MILFAHMLFGAAIGASINNPQLAIILAFLGHYFLDMFPHVEYLESAELSIKKLRNGPSGENGKNIIKVSVDFFIGLITIFLFSDNSLIIYASTLVAIFPDGLTVINTLFPNKPLAIHHKFHTWIQYFTKQKKYPIFWRISTQVLIIFVSILLLTN